MQVIRPNPEGTRSKSADREAQIPLRTIFAKAKKEDSSFDESLVAGVGFEPHDLRVMSPTSYQTAPSRDISGAGSRGRTGTRNKSHGILSPGRLPIPPFRHASDLVVFQIAYTL